MTSQIRTRFAPSPTGLIHLAISALRSIRGPLRVIRAALLSCALKTPILNVQPMRRCKPFLTVWHGFPWILTKALFFQSQRLSRYAQVIADLLDAGLAYRCYMRADELDELRAHQRAQGLTPRYDGRWRPEPGKKLPAPPVGVEPV